MVTKDNDKNADLTRRINADLRAKMEATQNPSADKKDPDFAEGSEYVKNFSKTGKFAWVWIVLGLIAMIFLIVLGVTNH